MILNDGSEISYEYLINTSPLNRFLTLFDEEKKMHELQSRLSYNKVLVFNLGFNKKSKYTKEHWFYIPDKKINFTGLDFTIIFWMQTNLVCILRSDTVKMRL